MSLHIARPSALLSPFIKQYWAVENFVPYGEKFIHRIIPSGLIELTFYLGDRPLASDQNKNLEAATVVSGHQKRFYEVEVTGTLSMFSVTFLPYGAMMFFDLPLNELFDQNVPLKYLLKNETSKLEDQLSKIESFEGKIRVVEQFLVHRLSRNFKEFEINRMCTIIDHINKFQANLAVDTLAGIACLSRKQFERTFNQFIGTSPKQFLKTIRFQNSIYQKQLKAVSNLTDLAYETGYYDQSHMIADFRSLAGMTPRQFFAECAPYSDYFC